MVPRQLNDIWGLASPPEVSGTTKGMTMKFLPDVGILKEARNKKKRFDITGSVCKLHTKIPKIPIFGSAASRHANLTIFCMIVTSEINPEVL